jgi:hypothetical protein
MTGYVVSGVGWRKTLALAKKAARKYSHPVTGNFPTIYPANTQQVRHRRRRYRKQRRGGT